MSTHHSPAEANEEFAPRFQHRDLGSTSRVQADRAPHYNNIAGMNHFDHDEMDFSLMESL
jgi:hypothetical protein